VDTLWIRIQGRLADRFQGIQYPAPDYHPTRRAPFFKYQMPIWKRMSLFFFSILMILLGVTSLAVGTLIAYVVVRAICAT